MVVWPRILVASQPHDNRSDKVILTIFIRSTGEDGEGVEGEKRNFLKS